jgi:hypothetical protein
MDGTLLEAQKDGGASTDTQVSKAFADLDVISLGPGMVNLYSFLKLNYEVEPVPNTLSDGF